MTPGSEVLVARSTRSAHLPAHYSRSAPPSLVTCQETGILKPGFPAHSTTHRDQVTQYTQIRQG